MKVRRFDHCKFRRVDLRSPVRERRLGGLASQLKGCGVAISSTQKVFLPRTRNPGLGRFFFRQTAGRQVGRSASRHVGRSASRQVGRSAGRQQVGRSQGRQVGMSAGRRVGDSASRQVGKSAGRQVGNSAGRQVARGHGAGRQVGWSAGWRVGRPPGRSANWHAGRSAGTASINSMTILTGVRPRWADKKCPHLSRQDNSSSNQVERLCMTPFPPTQS